MSIVSMTQRDRWAGREVLEVYSQKLLFLNLGSVLLTAKETQRLQNGVC